jgi:muramoyltetrapeptide carboxypeptidase
MVSLIGTKYDFNTKNKIICIEEVNEPPYKIDRMFTQLLMSGKLNQATGIILGQFNKCEPENFNINQKDSMHLKEILLEKIKPLNIPALYGFSFGHIREQAILPFGAHVNLNTELFQFSFKRKELKEFL